VHAEGRGWIVFANDVLIPAGSAAMLAIAGGATGDTLARPLGALRDALAKLEAQLARGGGPVFLGRDFSLVDASVTEVVTAKDAPLAGVPARAASPRKGRAGDLLRSLAPQGRNRVGAEGWDQRPRG
jgi:glutathione S-transferase